MQTVILAAGKGSRLHPLTLTRTKAMLPIMGKPMIARVMDPLVGNDLRDFIIVVNPDDREIREYFSRNPISDASIQFIVQPEQLGMADALSHAVPLIHGDFFLSACDNLVSKEDVGRMLQLWDRTLRPGGLLALMNVPPTKIKSSGIVEMNGELVKNIIEKPDPIQVTSNTASLPLYIFSRHIVDYLPEVQLSQRGEYELQDAIQLMIKYGGHVRGCNTEGRFTLTSPADLLALNRHYLQRDDNCLVNSSQNVGLNTRFFPPIYIESGVVIGADCEIGPNVFIEHDCQIEKGVVIRESVLLRRTTVPADSVITGQVVVM